MTYDPKLPVSEIFMSIQGEGPYTGHPMLFVRTFGCNMTCKGFSNPDSEDIEISRTAPLPVTGCDSVYSWHSAYKPDVKSYSSQELLEHMLTLLPGNTWINEKTTLSPILCFTGGEPLLHQRFLTHFFTYVGDVVRNSQDPPPEAEFNTVLFETNGSVALGHDLELALLDWKASTPLPPDYVNARVDAVRASTWSSLQFRTLIWSVSPKLSNSGEPRHKAIRPDVIERFINENGDDLYLKFVSSGSDDEFEEIRQTVEAMPLRYQQDVYVMPEGHTTEQQMRVQERVALGCITHGYIFCCRVHCFVFNNRKGT